MAQGHGMRHKILRVRPSLNLPSVHAAGGIARFLATRFGRLAAPAISSSRITRRRSTTSAIRGSEARNQLMAWRNCISSAPVSGRASYQTNLASVRGHATHAPVSTPYQITRSHGRKWYTREQPQTIPHSLNEPRFHRWCPRVHLQCRHKKTHDPPRFCI